MGSLQEHKFNALLCNTSTQYGRLSVAYSVDSAKTPEIWASDFIAGAFNYWLSHQKSEYVDLLKSKFIGPGYKIFKF